jgi:hypothetical protein
MLKMKVQHIVWNLFIRWSNVLLLPSSFILFYFIHFSTLMHVDLNLYLTYVMVMLYLMDDDHNHDDYKKRIKK